MFPGDGEIADLLAGAVGVVRALRVDHGPGDRDLRGRRQVRERASVVVMLNFRRPLEAFGRSDEKAENENPEFQFRTENGTRRRLLESANWHSRQSGKGPVLVSDGPSFHRFLPIAAEAAAAATGHFPHTCRKISPSLSFLVEQKTFSNEGDVVVAVVVVAVVVGFEWSG